MDISGCLESIRDETDLDELIHWGPPILPSSFDDEPQNDEPPKAPSPAKDVDIEKNHIRNDELTFAMGSQNQAADPSPNVRIQSKLFGGSASEELEPLESLPSTSSLSQFKTNPLVGKNACSVSQPPSQADQTPHISSPFRSDPSSDLDFPMQLNFQPHNLFSPPVTLHNQLDLDPSIHGKLSEEDPLSFGPTDCADMASTSYSPRGLEEWANQLDGEIPIAQQQFLEMIKPLQNSTPVQFQANVFGPLKPLSPLVHDIPSVSPPLLDVPSILVDSVGQITQDASLHNAPTKKQVAAARRAARKRKRQAASRTQKGHNVEDLTNIELDIKKKRRVKNRASVEKCRWKQKVRLYELEYESQASKKLIDSLTRAHQKLESMYGKLIQETQTALGRPISPISL